MARPDGDLEEVLGEDRDCFGTGVPERELAADMRSDGEQGDV